MQHVAPLAARHPDPEGIRKVIGAIIRDRLRDEVLMGNLTPWELELITSPVGPIKATFSYGGSAGRKFIDAAARLAPSKRHTGRATMGRKMTVSADLIYPVRQDIFRLRGEVSKAMGKPVQQPQPWLPPGAPVHQQPQAQLPGGGPLAHGDATAVAQHGA
jgi:hypothetical protein